MEHVRRLRRQLEDAMRGGEAEVLAAAGDVEQNTRVAERALSPRPLFSDCQHTLVAGTRTPNGEPRLDATLPVGAVERVRDDLGAAAGIR
jgi:hypothetical protein